MDALTVDQLESLIGAKIDRRSLPKGRSMAIDLEFLEGELTNVRAQKENARDVYQQAHGAEQMLMALIERAKEPEAKQATGKAAK